MSVKYFKESGLLFLFFFLLYLTPVAQNRTPSRLYQAVQQKQHLLSAGKNLQQFSLFQQATTLQLSKNRIADNLLEKKTILYLKKSLQSTLLLDKSDLVKLEIPVNDKKVNLVLSKYEVNATNKAQVGTLQKMPGNGLHYRGYIDGDPHSLAAFSVFDDGSVVGLFANNEGNFILTKIKNSDEYIVYNDKDLKIKQPFICNTPDGIAKASITSGTLRTAGTPSVLGTQELQCRKIKCYWEADYLTYQQCGGNITATQNFMLALFNQVAAVYENDGIVLELSAYRIWDVTDPYSDNDVGSALNDFAAKWRATGNDYEGDVAFLIYGKYDAGLAMSLSGLCNKGDAYAAYGMYGATVYPWQTFSWNVEATCHELGHLFGLSHTQWCGWNTGPGNTCGAIDNCGPIEATDCQTCGSTFNDADPPAAWSGTIMSYCHLRPRGILMANGFGPLPGNYMRANITNSACLEAISTCPYEPCAAPVGLSSHGVGGSDFTYITCTWVPRQEALSYTLEYKKTKDLTWISISPVLTNDYTISIDGGADYVYRVKTNCSSSISNYSGSYPIGMACATPGPVTLSDISNTTATITWGGLNGAVSYTLEYKKASDVNWMVINNITNNVYQLTNLEQHTEYNYRIKKACTDYISTYTQVGSFTTSTCTTPVLNSPFININSVLLSWTVVPGNPSYVIEYRRSDETEWKSVTTQNGANSGSLADLEAGEDYVCRVKAKCAEGLFSDNSTEKTFSTPCAAPGLSGTSVNTTTALVYWAGTGAQSYIFDYKKSGDNDWISNTITDARINLAGLHTATTYQYRITSHCRKLNSASTVENTFTTLGEPLPLDLSEFEGIRNGNNNILYWTTYDEKNTDKFEIEYNIDNAPYQLAGTVVAAVNSSAALQYHFVHKDIHTDAYYRLKMIDKDGSFKYSNVIFLRADEDNKPCLLLNDPIYPIPFNNNLSMNIRSCAAQSAKVLMRGIEGRLVKTTTLSLKKGTDRYMLTGLETLSAGTYTLQLIPDKGDMIVRKVVKQ